ncbi:hypothetical protein NC652_036667 [Populus alba x Populus x berolinensis]|nr:hypothetical protein NC652_036667 [Populus alba x Populus x berolinensis]
MICGGDRLWAAKVALDMGEVVRLAGEGEECGPSAAVCGLLAVKTRCGR